MESAGRTNMEPDVAIDKKELEEAEKMAEENKNRYEYTHEFKKPFQYEGRTFEKIHFDWGRLTGNDGLAIENEMQSLGMPVVIPSLSGEYLIRMAARASVENIAANVLTAMPIRDYNKIRSMARSFLLKAARKHSGNRRKSGSGMQKRRHARSM